MDPYSNGELAQLEQAGRNAERCVCCGAIIPEGRQVCPICETRKYDSAKYEWHSIDICYSCRIECEDAINKLPSAQPEQRKGKWIWVDGVRCSNCYYKLQTTGLPSYCPNCGADMREEKTDDKR